MSFPRTEQTLQTLQSLRSTLAWLVCLCLQMIHMDHHWGLMFGRYDLLPPVGPFSGSGSSAGGTRSLRNLFSSSAARSLRARAIFHHHRLGFLRLPGQQRPEAAEDPDVPWRGGGPAEFSMKIGTWRKKHKLYIRIWHWH